MTTDPFRLDHRIALVTGAASGIGEFTVKELARAELRGRQPVGRLGKPEEVASAIRYLASDEAAFVTGSLLTIDGGWTAA